jgi:hypothetical protein
VVTISHVVKEKVGDDEKWCLYFENRQKALVLNKTNASSIGMLTSSNDFNDWPGAQVLLYGTPVSFKGQTTEAIRIKAVPRKRAPHPDEVATRHNEADPPPNLGEQLNDEIPW